MSAVKRLLYSTRYLCKNFRGSITNLIRWFPIIWNDRDWDHYYLEKMIITKLQQMATFFEQHGNHQNAKVDAARMRTVCKLLNRIEDGYYADEYRKHYEQDYHILPDGLLEWIKPETDTLGKYFDKYPRIYSQAIRSFKASPKYTPSREHIAIKMSGLLEEKARNTAYKMISNYLPQWWD